MSTKQPIWKNGKIIIITLLVVLVGVIITQSMIAQQLVKKEGEKPEAKTVLSEGTAWDESWGLANQAISRGEFEDAEKKIDQAIAMAKQEGVKDSRLAAGLNCLALIYEKQGKIEEAGSLYEKALTIDEKTLGKNNPGLVNDLYNVALAKLNQKEYEKASELYHRALTINEKEYGTDDPRISDDLRNLARSYDMEGKYDEANKVCQRALELDKKAFGAESLTVATDLNNLALIAARQEKFDRAFDYAEQAESMASRYPEHPNSTIIKKNNELLLASFEKAYLEGSPDKSAAFPTDAFDKAKELKLTDSEKAKELLLTNLPAAAKAAPGSLELAKYLVRLNNVLFAQGNDSAAIKYGEVALKILAREKADNQELVPWLVNVESYLAMSYERLGYKEKVEKNSTRALALARQATEHYREAIKLAKEAPAGKVTGKWMDILQKGLATSESQARSI